MITLPPPIGPRSTEILHIFWSHKRPLHSREVHAVMHERHGLAYTTVTGLLSRLAQQGLLERKRSGMHGAYAYEAACSPEALVEQLIVQIRQQFGVIV